MITWGVYIIRFFIVLLAQGLIVNNIHLGLGDLANISIYPLFILMLPFETPLWISLISSLLLGLSVDSFTNTIGLVNSLFRNMNNSDCLHDHFLMQC